MSFVSKPGPSRIHGPDIIAGVRLQYERMRNLLKLARISSLSRMLEAACDACVVTAGQETKLRYSVKPDVWQSHECELPLSSRVFATCSNTRTLATTYPSEPPSQASSCIKMLASRCFPRPRIRAISPSHTLYRSRRFFTVLPPPLDGTEPR
nr:hypothetical protein CFP56_57013 [Quercus suber]